MKRIKTQNCYTQIKVKLAGESKRKAMGTHKESDALRSLWWDKNEV